jgi:hypothetical protein
MPKTHCFLISETNTQAPLYEICDQLKNIVPDKIKKSEFI